MRVGRQAGGRERGSWGASVFELPPGSSMLPMPAHLRDEELLMVLTGTPTMRSADDAERGLCEREVVSFLAGTGGAHLVRNDTATTIRLRRATPATLLRSSDPRGD